MRKCLKWCAAASAIVVVLVLGSVASVAQDKEAIIRDRQAAMKLEGPNLRAINDYLNDKGVDQATAIAQATGQPADIAAVRATHTKFGVASNLQQQVTSDLGLFLRASSQQGQYEAFEFTDVHESYALGLSLTGERWNRRDDTFGAGAVVNRASGAALRFFNAGGLGILVGDGQLPRPGSEQLIEMYYRYSIVKGVQVSLDYQYIDNPAYNRDRGPVSVFGARLHAQY